MILVAIEDQFDERLKLSSEERQSFLEGIRSIPNIVLVESNLFSLQVELIREPFLTNEISVIVLIDMSLRYDNVAKFLVEVGNPPLIEFSLVDLEDGWQEHYPRYETSYPRKSYLTTTSGVLHFLNEAVVL